jgi:hypothetical protein
MSRLAAVHTSQPTQGVNSVPNGKTKAAPTRTVEDLDKELAALNAPPPTINPRSAHSAAAATLTAAWLSLSATELEVRNYFRAIEVQSGLEALAKMRKQCDLAAQTLQQRMDDGNTERCHGCGKTLEEARKTQWLFNSNVLDPETGTAMCYHYCNALCVREVNREKMLPPEQRKKYRFDGQEEGDIR